MKRPTYISAVQYIAFNDDDGASDAKDLETVRGYISTQLVAAIFDIDADRVARDIIRQRIQRESA